MHSEVSDNEGGKLRVQNAEIQNKNIKNLKNVLKAKRREKKEKRRQEKDDSVKRRKMKRGSTKGSLRGMTSMGGLKRSRAISKKMTSITTDQRRSSMSEDDDNSEEDEFKRMERHLRRS